MKEIFSVLKKEKKGFVSFILSRIGEFADSDQHLAKILRYEPNLDGFDRFLTIRFYGGRSDGQTDEQID
jgi:hypothetical protein